MEHEGIAYSIITLVLLSLNTLVPLDYSCNCPEALVIYSPDSTKGNKDLEYIVTQQDVSEADADEGGLSPRA